METKIESKKNIEKNKQPQNKKQNNPQKKTKLPFEEEIFMRVKPEIFFKNGLRFIKEYSHVFRTFVKRRWEDQSIYQVFCKEFLAYTPEYYKESILSGRIKVNEKIVDLEYKLKANDLIIHEAIRKEPPVYDTPIEIIYEDDELLVINKPSSMPVHVCGNHCFNTIIGILRSDYKYNNLHTLHRLDKLTSGLLLISKNPNLSSTFHQEIKNKNVEKIYLARVHGEFLPSDQPNNNKNNENAKIGGNIEESIKIKNEMQLKETNEEKKQEILEKIHNNSNDDDLKVINKEEIQIKPNDNTSYFTLSKPIYCVSHKKGEYDVCSQEDKEKLGGKDCITNFKLIWYDSLSDTSLVECKPITGKTHQIRVHLKSLGYPIINDVNYGGKFLGNFFLRDKEKNSNDEQEIHKKLKINENDAKVIEKEGIKEEFNVKGEKEFIMEICLHSYRYTFRGKTFQSKMPLWAAEKNIKSLI